MLQSFLEMLCLWNFSTFQFLKEIECPGPQGRWQCDLAKELLLWRMPQKIWRTKTSFIFPKEHVVIPCDTVIPIRNHKTHSKRRDVKRKILPGPLVDLRNDHIRMESQSVLGWRLSALVTPKMPKTLTWVKVSASEDRVSNKSLGSRINSSE